MPSLRKPSHPGALEHVGREGQGSRGAPGNCTPGVTVGPRCAPAGWQFSRPFLASDSRQKEQFVVGKHTRHGHVLSTVPGTSVLLPPYPCAAAWKPAPPATGHSPCKVSGRLRCPSPFSSLYPGHSFITALIIMHVFMSLLITLIIMGIYCMSTTGPAL